MKIFNFVLCLAAIFMLCSCSALSNIDTDLEFCYTKDDGTQYCGKIGVDLDDSTTTSSLVLNEKRKGTTKKLYTLTNQEIKNILKKLAEKNKTKNIDYHATPFQKLKKYMQ